MLMIDRAVWAMAEEIGGGVLEVLKMLILTAKMMATPATEAIKVVTGRIWIKKTDVNIGLKSAAKRMAKLTSGFW